MILRELKKFVYKIWICLSILYCGRGCIYLLRFLTLTSFDLMSILNKFRTNMHRLYSTCINIHCQIYKNGFSWLSCYVLYVMYDALGLSTNSIRSIRFNKYYDYKRHYNCNAISNVTFSRSYRTCIKEILSCCYHVFSTSGKEDIWILVSKYYN